MKRMIKVTPTCGFATTGLTLCGNDALFRYSGLVQVKQGESYAKAIARRGRMIIDLCMDHSRVVFVSMEAALRERSATMRCLVQTRLTLHCLSCHSLYRFEPLQPTVNRHADAQSVHNGYTLVPNHYCPNCGAGATAEFDPSLDYWEILSSALELTPALTQQIYSLFLSDKSATARFVDYVTALQHELDTE